MKLTFLEVDGQKTNGFEEVVGTMNQWICLDFAKILVNFPLSNR